MLERFTAVGWDETEGRGVFSLLLVSVVSRIALKWKVVYSVPNNRRRGLVLVKCFEAAVMKNVAHVESKACVWAFNPPEYTGM